MRRNIAKIALVFLLLLLSGCSGGKIFQPPPPEFEAWKKSDASSEDVKRAMLNCGYPNIYGTDRGISSNADAAMFVCMRKAGFNLKSGFEFCKLRMDLPACAEYNQGSPLTMQQLEQLPYNDDYALTTLRPAHNSGPVSLVTWRKPDSSLHFKDRIENDRATLQVMYSCGYPNPLGKGATATLKEVAKLHSCMEEKGYIGQAPSSQPHHTLFPVCREHPSLSPCNTKNGTMKK